MMKTLLTDRFNYGGATLGAAMLLAGMLTIAAAHADNTQSGTGNDRTGTTTNNWNMDGNSSQKNSTKAGMRMAGHHLVKPNDDIEPSAGPASTAPSTHNEYGTTESEAWKGTKFGG